MATSLISEDVKKSLREFLEENPKCDLLQAYLVFVEQHLKIKPVLYPATKIIYKSVDEAVEQVEAAGKLWREAKIRISFSKEAVNKETSKVYICPFSGKVFGNNTHPNPQDAIYDWVSKCPENTERAGGLKVKRFFVSEDPEVIKNYITERKEPVTKTVYSSVASGKLFNSRSAVIRDFRENQLKPIGLSEALGQNRFDIEEHFLAFLQGELEDEKVGAFVEELSEHEEFTPYVARWVE